eukprot:CAMPEP_0113305962 /NCGR_PEP_ID=MMETSP0010_2-20120614/5401_1 /TAXON_ID=216773 ORGANISM="Corethron hystrix, Strain 308" /NCGR_SAMPLE_ID=MMETSP0010_2 /ASSEMBLY_ACC=CAM_ASM_000155 /LENGTH=1397 /DNA_ID=CAMNT_0000160529 /DNA_START=240 /DNA_END=4434 /DNA_ORIENTATION=+ /assembly_acc=CAM_ASM_000155
MPNDGLPRRRPVRRCNSRQKLFDLQNYEGRKRTSSSDDSSTGALSLPLPKKKRQGCDENPPSLKAEKVRGCREFLSCGSSLALSPSRDEDEEDVSNNAAASRTEFLLADFSTLPNYYPGHEANNKRSFGYDAVLPPETSQEDVYIRSGAARSIQNEISKGLNVTILSYGQTGSGKTYTMGTHSSTESYDAVADGQFHKDDGIIPRAVHDLFEVAAASKRERAASPRVSLSYMEIYNEEIRDLLQDDASGPSVSLQVRDTTDGSVHVVGLSSHEVSSPENVDKLTRLASSRRVIASTAMNSVSSRSHVICTLLLTMNCDAPDANTGFRQCVTAKLTLVDLAGSERMKRTGAEGTRMQEGIGINKGLSVLGRVVSSLADPQNSSTHIPYRDSKLTRLLQDSLGGNSCTIMIGCVSPASDNVDESISTLRYMERARNIRNSAVRNVVTVPMSLEEATKLRNENVSLKLQLMQAKSCLDEKCHNRRVNKSEELPQNEANTIDEIDMEKNDLVVDLRTKCLILEKEAKMLNEQLKKRTQESMAFSEEARKWQFQYENALQVIDEYGLGYSDEKKDIKKRYDVEKRLMEVKNDEEVTQRTTDTTLTDDTCTEFSCDDVSIDGNVVLTNDMEQITSSQEDKLQNSVYCSHLNDSTVLLNDMEQITSSQGDKLQQLCYCKHINGSTEEVNEGDFKTCEVHNISKAPSNESIVVEIEVQVADSNSASQKKEKKNISLLQNDVKLSNKDTSNISQSSSFDCDQYTDANSYLEPSAQMSNDHGNGEGLKVITVVEPDANISSLEFMDIEVESRNDKHFSPKISVSMQRSKNEIQETSEKNAHTKVYTNLSSSFDEHDPECYNDTPQVIESTYADKSISGLAHEYGNLFGENAKQISSSTDSIIYNDIHNDSGGLEESVVRLKLQVSQSDGSQKVFTTRSRTADTEKNTEFILANEAMDQTINPDTTERLDRAGNRKPFQEAMICVPSVQTDAFLDEPDDDYNCKGSTESTQVISTDKYKFKLEQTGNDSKSLTSRKDSSKEIDKENQRVLTMQTYFTSESDKILKHYTQKQNKISKSLERLEQRKKMNGVYPYDIDSCLRRSSSYPDKLRNLPRQIDRSSKSWKRFLTSPLSFSLGSEIRNAARTIRDMCGHLPLFRNNKIPANLIRNAHGLVFLTVARGGLCFSGRIGSGLVLARNSNGGWSPPCAIATAGIGWGALVGADITEFVFVLNHPRALQALAAGQLDFGTECTVSAGPVRPVGTRLGVSTFRRDGAPKYCYSHSKGVFAGLSVEGSFLAVQNDVNEDFYGYPIDSRKILLGDLEGETEVRAAKVLYDVLNNVCAMAYVPCIPPGNPIHGNDTDADSVSGADGQYILRGSAIGSRLVIDSVDGATSVFKATQSYLQKVFFG